MQEAQQALAAFQRPDFALCEVTEDVRYSGGELAAQGLPQFRRPGPTFGS